MRSFLTGSLCIAALACGPTQRIDLCRRGDRVDVTTFRLSALDGNGTLLDQWDASADHSSTSEGPIDGTRRVRVDGLDVAGTVVAFGDAAVTDSDAVCVCVTGSAQHPIACRDVVCRVVSGRCTFTDPSGAPLGPRSYSFGDNTSDDVTAVTLDTFIGGDAVDQPRNFGGDDAVKVKADPAAPRVGLWRFELRGIPSTAQVISASFAITTTDNGTANPVDVYAVLEDWEPGTGNGTPGCSNWTCRKLQGGQQDWATPGAGAPGSSASPPLLSIYPQLIATRYESSSEALRQLVQTWVATPAANFGITGRMPAAAAGSSCDLVSSEGADGARPQLRVELAVPPETR